MSGIQDFNNKWENKISQRLKEHPELTGYANYIRGTGALSTNHQYIYQVGEFLSSINKNFAELEFDDYISYLAQLRSKTPSYQRMVFYALKKFSEYLAFSNKNSLNPMQKIRPPKKIELIETKQKREIGFLTKEEVDIALNTVKNGTGSYRAQSLQKNWRERDMAIMYIFLATGMRCSALIKLDLNNINWEDSTIVTIDKGNKVHKYILSENVKKILETWVQKREMLLEGKEEEALFISNKKKRIGTTTVADIVKKYSSGIEGKHITPHKLRATFGTHLYNETRDIKFVQDQMGHSNPQTTELYIRGNQDADRKKASDIMGKFLD